MTETEKLNRTVSVGSLCKGQTILTDKGYAKITKVVKYKHPMKYLGSCVGWPYSSVQHLVEMCNSGRTISWRTFRRNIGKDSYDELARRLGYPCGELRLETDYAASFHKGKYRGQTAYWCEHSRIEYAYTVKGDY